MLMSKLPRHLASLLRHQTVPAPAAVPASGGKAGRRRLAGQKRRARAREERTKEREAREARVKIAGREAGDSKVKKVKKVEKVKVEKKVEKVEKKEVKAKKMKKRRKIQKEESRLSSFDEGAARDQALLQDLEKKLGLAGNDQRRRKEERQIFKDLFDADDLGVEEPPSSDEQPLSEGEGKQQAESEHILGLIDSILGGPRQAGKAQAKAKGAKGPKKLRAR